MADSADGVGQAIEEIALVASDTTAATNEVSAATVDTSGRMDEMRKKASDLAVTAEQLRSLVSRFELGDGARAQKSADWGQEKQPGARRRRAA